MPEMTVLKYGGWVLTFSSLLRLSIPRPRQSVTRKRSRSRAMAHWDDVSLGVDGDQGVAG